jgi:small-conductance mechanosensitive channel
MSTGNTLDQIASAFTALLAGGLRQWCGAGIDRPVLGPITWSDLGVTGALVLLFFALHGIAAIVLNARSSRARIEARHLASSVLGALGKPLYLLIWTCGVYVSVTPLLLRLPTAQLTLVRGVFDALFDLGVLAALLWLSLRFTRVLEEHLAAWAGKSPNKIDEYVVPLVGKSARILLPVLAIIFALPVVSLPAQYDAIIGKGISILLIVAVALMSGQAVNFGQKVLLAKYDITVSDNLQARKLYTQVHVLSRTLYFIIALVAVASALMLFGEVRRLGTSMLASAGVVGVILGFAAQKTIANLFAGFQLAMTEPIRLDDVVIVENEWGRIEEITLTYVVVHIWDDRRLVVPLSYFIERPFQNWTRVSAELLGSVFVYVDYSFPVEEARQALKGIVESQPLWDKRFWNLQVTDANDKTMQLRVLATAADASNAWDLRCAIREQFIAYIQQHHPESLPRVRAAVESDGGALAAHGSGL